MPKKPASKEAPQRKTKKHSIPDIDPAAAMSEPTPPPVQPGMVQMPGDGQPVASITDGIGPAPATVARLSVRALTIVIVAAIAALLALAGIILPNLPASKLPPQNQLQ